MKDGDLRRFKGAAGRFLELAREATARREPELQALEAEIQQLRDELSCVHGEILWEATEHLRAELRREE